MDIHSPADPGQVADFDPSMVAEFLGLDAADLVIDDSGDSDPFAGLSPEWGRLARHLVPLLDLDSLPFPFSKFGPMATVIMTKHLTENPQESRATTLELIDIAVRDLGIQRAELLCWDDDGHPLSAGA